MLRVLLLAEVPGDGQCHGSGCVGIADPPGGYNEVDQFGDDGKEGPAVAVVHVVDEAEVTDHND